MVNIGKREGLNIVKHGFPEIFRKAGGSLCAEKSAHDAEKEPEKGNGKHF